MIDKTAWRQDEEDYDVYCDFCDNSESFMDMFCFSDLINELEESGWRIEKVNNEWEHQCPDCQKEREK